MSEFWSWWVIIIVAINIIGCFALLHWTRKIKDNAEGETTGHVYDGIEEYNNPLPRWWLNMFYITLVFSIIYLILYPGLGKFEGYFNWTQENQLTAEVESARESYQPLFDKYLSMPVEELVKVKQATEMGKRIFVNTCFGCHGSDARGNPGYPNLTDNDWLYGGKAEQIKHSIQNGRTGIMPAFGASLTATQIDGLVQYVGQLSGHDVDSNKAKIGQEVFAVQCFACHGNDGKGNILMGAPNLTDNIWLHSGSATGIAKTIREGRTGEMPAHADILGEAKTHLVTAYVYSLSNKK